MNECLYRSRPTVLQKSERSAGAIWSKVLGRAKIGPLTESTRRHEHGTGWEQGAGRSEECLPKLCLQRVKGTYRYLSTLRSGTCARASVLPSITPPQLTSFPPVCRGCLFVATSTSILPPLTHSSNHGSRPSVLSSSSSLLSPLSSLIRLSLFACLPPTPHLPPPPVSHTHSVDIHPHQQPTGDSAPAAPAHLLPLSPVLPEYRQPLVQIERKGPLSLNKYLSSPLSRQHSNVARSIISRSVCIVHPSCVAACAGSHRQLQLGALRHRKY